MQDFLKMFSRVLMYMVLWVFVLSISWNGRTLFDRAHGLLIENPIVEALDEQVGELWFKVREATRLTFSDEVGKDKEKF